MHLNFHKKQIQTLLISLLTMFTMPAIADNNSTTHPLIRLATTTSTENSGLLNHLLPIFRSASGYRVHVIAVGTGKALRMGKDGDVDVVLVHAPEAEAGFVDAGYGDRRHAVMYNDFVVVGPANDPAKINTAANITAAMEKIAAAQSLFISRGDDSGTHKKENQLWKTAGIKPDNSWHREAGQGMGKVIQIATELDAYTLTDRGTWLAYRDKSSLKIIFEGDEALHNPYGIIAVSAGRYPDINHTGALALIKWIRSKEAQQLISDYHIDGTRLFTPSANSEQIAASKESAEN
jgi:tungstate transport system substrate-binding protein